jgi:NAD(P)-dependent dehydrogenase (short-subunit alcohol dehydrogenase family)
MHIDLTGRTALVTGGSRGIGRSITERFARSGARVVILARRQAVIDETIAAAGADLTPLLRGFACDVAKAEEVEEVFGRVTAEVGGVDILVNNAGSSARMPTLALTRAALAADLELKLLAAVQLSQLVLPYMRRRRWGRIINMTTVNGKAPTAGGAPTALSRAAGLALTKVMASEFAPDNVLVNTICLGTVRSDQWTRFHQAEAPDMDFDDFIRTRASGVPLGRIGEPEEVANLACFLASDAASYITGTAINIDGGRSPVL